VIDRRAEAAAVSAMVSRSQRRTVSARWPQISVREPRPCVFPDGLEVGRRDLHQHAQYRPVGSEIRLIRRRYRGVFSGVQSRVFSTDDFAPLAQWTPVGHGRRPRRREDTWILDGEFELQSLTFIAGIALKAGIRSWEAEILPFAPFFRFSRAFVIEQPITFHDVQSFGVRRAKPVNRVKRPDLDAHGSITSVSPS
jgi:hypothetical protein